MVYRCRLIAYNKLTESKSLKQGDCGHSGVEPALMPEAADGFWFGLLLRVLNV